MSFSFDAMNTQAGFASSASGTNTSASAPKLGSTTSRAVAASAPTAAATSTANCPTVTPPFPIRRRGRPPKGAQSVKTIRLLTPSPKAHNLLSNVNKKMRTTLEGEKKRSIPKYAPWLSVWQILLDDYGYSLLKARNATGVVKLYYLKPEFQHKTLEYLRQHGQVERDYFTSEEALQIHVKEKFDWKGAKDGDKEVFLPEIKILSDQKAWECLTSTKYGFQEIESYYCLPGVDPKNSRLLLGYNYFRDLKSLRLNLCAYGIPDAKKYILEDHDLRTWLRLAVFTQVQGLTSLPSYAPLAGFSKAWIYLQKIGFKWGSTGYRFPNNEQRFDNEYDMMYHFSRFGLPNSAALDKIDQASLLALELYFADFPEEKRTSWKRLPFSEDDQKWIKSDNGLASVNKPVLPKNHTDSLNCRLRKLVSLWVDEEIMNGNKVSFKNIVSNDAMSAIVETVPLTIDKLSKLGALRINVLTEYGERLIKNIKAFIEQNALQVYVQNPEPTEEKSHEEGKEEEESTKRKYAVFEPDNEHLRTGNGRARRVKENMTILPKNHTDSLTARIKKLVSLWADEEIMNGNQVFYWNIMSNNAMMCIAETVPLTINELSDIGVLTENVVKEYGERLIKNIKAFIEQNALQVYLALKERVNVLAEENNNLKKEKIALERRSQDITGGLETLLKRAKTIDVIDEEEKNDFKKEKIALERRSQDITNGLETLLRQARTIDVIDDEAA